MKTNVKYFAKILLLGFLVIPFVLSMFTISLSGIGRELMLPVFAVLYIVGAFFGVKFLAKKNYPNSFIMRYLPVCIPLIVTVFSWAICMIISGGFYGHIAFSYMGLLEIAFLPMLIVMNLVGKISFIFYLPLIYNLSFLLFFIIFERRSENKQPISKAFTSVISGLLVISLVIGGGISFERSKTVLPTSYGFEHGNGFSSVDLWNYDIKNPKNILPKLDRDTDFFISDKNKMPVFDGAEAAYPVYNAFANACYNIQNEDAHSNNGNKIQFTNTIYAFERLISGEVDIFFGAEPSKSQKDMAQAAGKKLVLTPIGKEAFVFFVNKENSINNLTTQNIKDIYSGKIRNWSTLNTVDEKITAFQRPENSGSQTIMQKIMGDTPLMTPLKEEYIASMGGVLEGVANYRNFAGSIGYSFRFFTTGMANNSDEIKLISINDVLPNSENIKNSKYPYTVSLYAITVEDNELDTITPFLKWMQGEQGQELVEKIGYVRLK